MKRRATSTRAFTALAAALALGTPAHAEVRTARLVREGRDFASARLEPELSHRAGDLHASRDAVLVSQALDPGLRFSAVGPHWQGPSDMGLELSVSPDGVRWGRWIAVPREETIAERREDGEPNAFAGDELGALVFVDPESRFLRCRVRLHGEQRGESGLRRIAFHVIDPGPAEASGPEAPLVAPTPGPGPRTSASSAEGGPRRAAAPPPELPGPFPGVKKPPISLRAAWGARPPKTGYTYTRAGHIALHHTATVEDWEAQTWAECAARLRAIQTYHMDTQGWNDVGYAYVVCKHGDIFQAREDDDDSTDVQGAHDSFNRGSAGISAFGYFHPPVDHYPTAAQLSAIVDLISWIAGRRGIDPLGRSLYEAFGAPVDNIYGHREVGATACPGDHLFALKEAIRTAVSDRVLREFL